MLLADGRETGSKQQFYYRYHQLVARWSKTCEQEIMCFIGTSTAPGSAARTRRGVGWMHAVEIDHDSVINSDRPARAVIA